MRLLLPRRTPIALLACALVLAAPSVAPAKTDSATAGAVAAELTWDDRTGREPGTRLVIARNGVEAFAGSPKVRCGPDGLTCDSPWDFGTGDPLVARDLDGDGEPEVVVAIFTGGAHCCVVSAVYHFDAAAGTYGALRTDWGNPAYRLIDDLGDGIADFVGGDDRFSFAFSDYASSRWPLTVSNFRAGTMADVTRDHPALIRRHARALWREYLRDRGRRDRNVRGILAAYAADRYLLGEGAAGWRRLRAALRRGDLDPQPQLNARSTGRAYLGLLRKRLGRWGYR